MLEDLVIKQFKLDVHGDHGVEHWHRVKEIGRYLAVHTGADTKITDLFAILHDCKRENDSTDEHHGLRVTSFMNDLCNQGLLSLSNKEYFQLTIACTFHCLPLESAIDDITIQTCWDADRLDFWRLCVEPKKEFLNTDFAKQDEVIKLWRLPRTEAQEKINKLKEKLGVKCLCNDSHCAKCLGVACHDENCPVHTKEAKTEFRVLRGLSFGGRIGYQFSEKEGELVEKLRNKYFENKKGMELSQEDHKLIDKWFKSFAKMYPI